MILSDLVVQTVVNLHLIGGDYRNIQKQDIDTGQILEAEVGIGIRGIIKDLGIAIQEIVIRSIIVPVQADPIHQNVQRERLDLLPGKSHEVLQVIHNQI